MALVAGDCKAGCRAAVLSLAVRRVDLDGSDCGGADGRVP